MEGSSKDWRAELNDVLLDRDVAPALRLPGGRGQDLEGDQASHHLGATPSGES